MVNQTSLSTAGQSAGRVESTILEGTLPESLNSIKIFMPFDSSAMTQRTVSNNSNSGAILKNYLKERISFRHKDVHQNIIKDTECAIKLYNYNTLH